MLENEERRISGDQKRGQAGHPKGGHRSQEESREEMLQNLEQAAMGSDSGHHTELWEGASQAENNVLIRKQRGST